MRLKIWIREGEEGIGREGGMRERKGGEREEGMEREGVREREGGGRAGWRGRDVRERNEVEEWMREGGCISERGAKRGPPRPLSPPPPSEGSREQGPPAVLIPNRIPRRARPTRCADSR